MSTDNTPVAEALAAADRALLDALSSQVVPRGDGMPSAAEVGFSDAGVTRLMAIRPDLAEAVVKVVEKFRGASAPDVFELRQSDPELFIAFCLAVGGIYLSEPVVMTSLGFAGKKPAGTADMDEEALEQFLLVEPVRRRGDIWKSTPAQ